MEDNSQDKLCKLFQCARQEPDPGLEKMVWQRINSQGGSGALKKLGAFVYARLNSIISTLPALKAFASEKPE